MSLAVTKEKLNILLLQVLVFSLPIYQKFVPILIVAFAISTIYIFIKSKHKIKLTKPSIFLILFYLVLAIGLFWTDNIKAGVFDLEVKMSLVIFPVLFSMIKINEKLLIKVIKALTIGIFTFFLIAIVFAFVNNSTSNDPGSHHFLYSRLSFVIHPSYMSMYIVTAFVFIANRLKKGTYIFFSKRFTLIVLFFLFIINLMVLSKIGILIMSLFCLYYLYAWIKKSKRYITGFSIFTITILFFVLSYQNINYVAQRVDEFVGIFDSSKKNIANKSSSVRIEIWKQALSLIKEKPIFGYGTGDVKDVLIEKYIEFDLKSAVEHKYNTHNQFLQILISSGIVGLLLFLIALYYGFNLNPFFLNFIIITSLYMSVESILENQSGTIFYGLFFGLLNSKTLFLNEH